MRCPDISQDENTGFGVAGTDNTEDISLLPIRNFTLKKGEVCHRSLSSAETAYERLVHWSIRAKRQPDNGCPTEGAESVPMDALRFRNPFDVPITSSPLEIQDGGVILAQIQVPWINPKQIASVDITPALTVNGKVVEYEVAAQNMKRAEHFFTSVERDRTGKIVSGLLGGKSYRVSDIQGEIRLKNYRKQMTRLRIELNYSGTLVSAGDAPKETILNQTGAVNPCARLTWDINLGKDEEKTIKYRYNIFIQN